MRASSRRLLLSEPAADTTSPPTAARLSRERPRRLLSGVTAGLLRRSQDGLRCETNFLCLRSGASGSSAIELSVGTPSVGRPLPARNERERVGERGNPIKTRLLSPALSSSVGRKGEVKGSRRIASFFASSFYRAP